MPSRVFLWVIIGLLATASGAVATNSEVDGLVADLERELDGLKGETGDAVRLETATGDEPGLFEGLLAGTWQVLRDLGGMVAAGAHDALAATGAALTATGAAIVTAFVFSRDLVLWSTTGVVGLMKASVDGIVSTAVLLVSGAWGLLGSLSTSLAGARPAAVSETAWAGGIATSATLASAAGHYGLLNLLRRWGWIGAAGLPLFSRIEKDDLLDHPLRAEIFEAIKATPGIHVSALARTVDAGWGTTIHHLRKLKDEDLVAVRLVNNQKCYFANGAGIGRSAWSSLSHLKNPTARRIADFIHAHPLTPVTEVSEQLGIGASLVSHHVAKLTRAGVLEKVRDGRFIRLTVTADARLHVFNETQPVTQPIAVTGMAAS